MLAMRAVVGWTEVAAVVPDSRGGPSPAATVQLTSCEWSAARISAMLVQHGFLGATPASAAECRVLPPPSKGGQLPTMIENGAIALQAG